MPYHAALSDSQREMLKHYHYRSWSAKGYLNRVLRTLVLMKRHGAGQPLLPTETVIDSRSVRTGLPQAVSGIDGGKRVKGIKIPGVLTA